MKKQKHTILKLAMMVASVSLMAGAAHAGNLFLTGHDVDFHGGQNGFDAQVLKYLRGADQAGVGGLAAATYTVSFIGSGVGSASLSAALGSGAITTGGITGAGGSAVTIAGYAPARYYDTDTMTAADWTTALAGGALVILSHTSCGGCDLSDAGVTAVNAHALAIQAALTAGLDIWANTSGSNASYYGFLPASSTATGASISSSTGFLATAAGGTGPGGIGLSDGSSSMINGFPTHNQFTSFAGVFTVDETLTVTGGPSQVISLSVRDAVVTTTGISTGSVPDGGSTIAMLGLALLGLVKVDRMVRKLA
jgi:VPDSG-CTERM motif